MANLIFRESTTATIPASTSLKGSPLSNLEIDGNFRSINSHLSSHDTSINSITYDLSVLNGNITTINSGKPSNSGVGATGTWGINITGNAATVTGGVYTSGNQTIAGTKTFSSTISGSIDGNAATVTNGVYTTGNQTIAGVKTFTSVINASGGIQGVGTEQPGMVAYFAMATAPQGWLKANGAAVSRTTYAALFEAIGTLYGAGNGSTTFNLPDLRGEFLRSWDDGRSIDSGRTLGSYQEDSLESHTHSLPFSTAVVGETSGGNDITNTGTGLTSGATGGSETRPRNIALLACIKY